MSGADRERSAAEYEIAGPMVAWVVAADGVRLATDIYLPARNGRPLPGPWPALLERTPYSRRREFLLLTAHHFASRGYAVVLQDVRGRFDSEGRWGFLTEAEGLDGRDTIAWIVAQPWCSGRVGTMGLSFSSTNQQSAALQQPPGLAAQVLLDGGYSYYHRTVRQGGAFELGIMLPYAYRMARDGHELAADTGSRRQFEVEFANLDAWLWSLPWREGSSPLRLAPADERWFLAAQTRGEYDAFWKHAGWNVAEHVDRYPAVPILMEASWFGHHVWATVTRYRELRARRSAPLALLLGPWMHGYDDFARSWSGDVDFGPEAAIDVNDVRGRWFDEFLKGLDTGVLAEAPIRIFVMGGGSGRRNEAGRLEHGGTWRDEHEWPLARTRWTRFYLRAGGLLTETPPAPEEAPSRYVFDPRDPVPTVGGGAQASQLPGFIEGGGWDQRGRAELRACRGDLRPLAERADVLVFQTRPFEEDTEVTGPIVVRLWIASSAPDTDFTAKLVDVYPASGDYPDGYALNLTDGILRVRFRRSWEREELMAPGEICEITIEPQPTSNRFVAGHRLRLDVSSSNFPRFDVNPNTGEPLGRHTRTDVARQTVYHDAARPSHVVLPIVPRG